MSQFKFQSTLFRTSAEMHRAIADSYMDAGGANDNETILTFLDESSDAELAFECEQEWQLAECNDDGERTMPAYERAELLKAFEAFRARIDYWYVVHNPDAE
jgi:hypothetical protein